MSPEGISARLQEVARLTDLKPENRLLARTGYSAKQISQRLLRLSQLRSLCLELAKVETRQI